MRPQTMKSKRAAAEAAVLLADLDNALLDWLRTYASEECKPEHVAESTQRIFDGGGTLYYIARLRARLAALRKKERAR